MKKFSGRKSVRFKSKSDLHQCTLLKLVFEVACSGFYEIYAKFNYSFYTHYFYTGFILRSFLLVIIVLMFFSILKEQIQQS